MSNNISLNTGIQPILPTSSRIVYWISRKWFLVISIILALYVGLPFLAPVFMQIGWDGPGQLIYTIYSFLCHQLPQRSFFFFGTKTMYSIPEIQAVWQDTLHPHILRQFIGNSQIGWKVAWSDRMVSMYGSMLLFAWVWYPLRRRLKSLPFWGLIILVIPMAVDGVTHLISDLAGLGQGFRDSNAWLAGLTNNAFGADFYAGDALGSFNSWMRFITGTLFGIGVVWFGIPLVEELFTDIANSVDAKLKKLENLNQNVLEEIFEQ